MHVADVLVFTSDEMRQPIADTVVTMFDIITAAAALSFVVSLIALWYSRTAARAAREQAATARNANLFAREARHAEAVLQFTGRYAELIDGGLRFGHRSWEYQFWALYALEYFFYERRWMPSFIFELWMIELASMYESGEVRASHVEYLGHDVERPEGMASFFGRLLAIAESCSDDRATRSREIMQLVRTWPRAGENRD